MSEKNKRVHINAQGVKGSLNTKILDENHHLRSTFEHTDILSATSMLKKKQLVQFHNIRIEQLETYVCHAISKHRIMKVMK